MPTVLNNIGISGDYGQIVFRNDGINNLIDLSHSNTRIVAYDMSINNILKAGQVLGTKSGKVIELSGNALLVPVGTDNQRPNNPTGDVNLGEIGMMRYNTTSNTFEGYGPTAWGSLGGVINTQQTTFVEAIDQHENPDISSNSIQFTTSGELVAVINYDGNVGIGTTNPQYLLDVYDPNQTFINIGVGPGAPSSNGSLQLIKGDNARIRTTGSDDVLFDTNSSERMRIKDTGEVGIGTDSPVAQLDVSGDVHIKGVLTGYGTGTGGNNASYFGLRHANPFGFTHNQFLLRDNGDIYLGSKKDRQIAFFNGDPSNRANEFMRLQNGNLEMHDGDISLNGNILALGDISLNGKLYATNDVSFNENINVGGDASFNSSLSIDGDLNVDTNATISGNLDIKTNATVDNDFHVKNDATIDNDVVVNGSGTIEKDFHIKRHLTVDGSLSFLGDFIQRDTIIQVTEQMDLSNDGTGPALIVRQHGAQPVATFYDDTTMAMIIKDGGDVSFNSNVVVDGSVGIGSNAPSELLDIAGGNIRLHNGDNLYIGDSLTDSLRFQHITNGTSYIDYNTNKPLYFRTTTSGSSTNVMHLRKNGYVGIMDSGLAGARLDVKNESGSVPVLNVRQDDDAANIAEFHHGANQVMVIDNSGRLGIGITNPTQQLEVSGNVYITGNEITIDSPEDYCYFTGSDPVTVFQGGTTTRLTAQDGPIEFHAGNGGAIERARITSGGLVGIGTDDPSTRLDISNNTSNSVLAVRQHDLAENIAEFYNGANQVMVIDNSGSLGINRSDVTAGVTLDVSGAAIVSNTLRIRDDAAPEGGEIVIEGPSDSNRFHLDVTQGGHFRIFKTPNPQGHSLFIDKTTNFIGLNGASPAVELDISGTGAIRIPVGNDSTQRPYGANGMIRYNAVSEVYEAYNSANNSGLGGWGALGGGGGGSLTANSRRIPQGDVLFNVDVSAGTPYEATLFMVRKNAISDDGNRIVITDSTIDATDANHTYVKIYDYNPDNNQYELKQTITVERDGNTTTTDAEGIRGVHITGDKQTILVVTANLSATDPNTRYDGSYNFIPYELTNSIDVVYTAGNTLTLQNTPWYDMDDGTTLMVGERESTNSDRDVHFYSYSSSEKQFTLKQTIPYLNDISNALPNAGTAKHVAISGDGLRALWVDGTGNNVIIFKRLSTFSEFQILQTIRDIASGSTPDPDIYSLYTLSNFDYHGKFLALNFATSSTSKVRIYAYDEVKFNYVSASEFTNITNVNSDLITSEPHISKDGTRLFVNHFENDENSLTDNGVISMLKLDKQGKVPIASVDGAVITASAEFIMYGESANDRFGFDTVADYHGKRIIGAGKNTNTNTSNNNVRVIQTETTILATNTTINTSEIVTLSGSLKLYPQNNIVDIYATTNIEQDLIVDGKIGIGTTNPQVKLQVGGNSNGDSGGTNDIIQAYIFQVYNSQFRMETQKSQLAFRSLGPNGIGFYTTAETDNEITDAKMIIKSNGNVGIGTTNPQSKLDVSGSISSSYDSDTTSYFGNAAIGYANSATLTDWASFAHIDSNSSTGFALIQNTVGRTKLNAASSQKIQFTIGNSEKMVLDSNGNVGIGTDDPKELLHVGKHNATNDTYIKVQTGAAKKAGIQYVGGNAYIWHTHHDDNGNKFHVGLGTTGGSSEYLTIDSAGNVGIGSSVPSEALDVNGTIRATNNIYVGVGTNAVVTTGDTGTVSNTMLANSTISGVGLGSNLKTLTAGNGISMTNYNGSTERTIRLANTFTVTGDIKAGTITAFSGTEGIRLGQHEIKLTNSGAAHYSLVNASYVLGSGSTYNNLEIRNTSSNNALGIFDTSSSDKKLMTFNSGGNVGIGTTNPQTALQISSSSGLRLTNTAIKSNANERIGYIDFSNYNNETGAAIESCVGVGTTPNNADLRFMTTLDFGNKYVERMRIDRDGNVGIGTTDPSEALDVSGNVFVGYHTGIGSTTGFDRRFTIAAGSQQSRAELYFGTAFKDSTPIKSAIIAQGIDSWSRSKLMFCLNNNADNNPSYTASTSDARMTILPSGNVGIGTTNPQYKLDVSGSISSSYDSDTTSYFGNAAIGYANSATYSDWASFAHIDSNNNTGFALVQNAAGRTKLNASSSQKIQFTIGNSEKMVLDSNGNVGIGTADPSANLHVNHDFHIAANSSTWGNPGKGLYMRYSTTTGSGQDEAYIQSIDRSNYPTTVTRYPLYFEASKYNFSNGNVGIGTTVPSEALDVNGSIRIRKGNDLYIGDSIWDSLRFKHEGSGLYNYIDYNNNSSIRFRVTASGTPSSVSTTMTLDKDGNVGIGSASPAYKLDVNGAIRATGNITANNFNGVANTTSQFFPLGTTPETYQTSDIRVNNFIYTKAIVNTTEGGTSPAAITFGDGNSLGSDQISLITSGATRLYIKSDGNVGIGTTDPQELLHVGKHNATNDTYIKVQTGSNKKAGIQYVGSTDIWHTHHDDYDNKFHVGLGTTGGSSEYLTIDSAGNVGIGTTVPRYELDVSGSITAQTVRIGNMGYGPGHGGIKFHNLGTQSFALLQKNDGETFLNCASDCSINFQVNNITKMIMDKDGNVGIGTTNPASGYKLDVNGTIRATTNIYVGAYPVVTTGDTGTVSNTMLANSTISGVGLGSNLKTLTAGNGISMTNYNGSTERTIRLANTFTVTGDIKAGTITAHNDTEGIQLGQHEIKLTNAGAAHYSLVNASYVLGSGLTYNNLEIRNTSSNNALGIFNSSDKKLMAFNSGGNVGIGTTNPQTALQISSSSGLRLTNTAKKQNANERIGYIDFSNYNNGTGAAIESCVNVGTVANNADLRFMTSYEFGSTYVERMRIDREGRVGIGSGSPSSKLDVFKNFGGVSNGNYTGRIYGTDGGLGETGIRICEKGGGSLINNSTKALDVYAGGSSKMVVTGAGRVGIGTANPIAPLHVKAGTSRSLTGGYYFDTFNGTLAYGTKVYSGAPASGSALNESIFAEGGITSEQGFYADSDSRIKTNISDINDESALTKLREIEPKTYQYIDTIKRNNVTVYGFIAQQIKEVLPKAVTFQNRTIPSIFELCNATSSSNNEYYDTIHFTDFNTANLDASSNNLVIVDANNEKHAVNILSVLDSSNVQVDTDVSEWMAAVDASGNVTPNEVQKYEKVIFDTNNIVVLENYDIAPIASMDASGNVVGKMADLSGGNTIDNSNNYVDASGSFIAAVNPDGHYIDASGNYFDTNGNFMDASNNLVGTYKTEWKNVIIHGTTTFVYGQEVDNFHVLQKEYIFTVATAALQEVDRQLQAEKAKVSVLESDLTAEKAKTATLESQMADLLARVSALESA